MMTIDKRKEKVASENPNHEKSAHPKPRSLAFTYQQVGVERPLVGLVDDDGAVPPQQKVLLDFSAQERQGRRFKERQGRQGRSDGGGARSGGDN